MSTSGTMLASNRVIHQAKSFNRNCTAIYNVALSRPVHTRPHSDERCKKLPAGALLDVNLPCRKSRENALRCRASYNQLPARYGGEGPGSRSLAGPSGAGNGVFLLMLACCLVFLADNLLHLPGVSALYLNHARPQWWQFVTHMFCHANWAHLSGNLFNLCVFGRMVEETEGAAGLVTAFLVCGLGAALATFLLTPAVIKGHATVSVGASGAIFGLFAVSVATRLRWNLKQLLEAAVLGQFVVRQVLEEARHQVSGGLVAGGLAVSHAAHLAGAAVGVLLVLLLQRLPEPPAGRSAAGPSGPGSGFIRG